MNKSGPTVGLAPWAWFLFKRLKMLTKHCLYLPTLSGQVKATLLAAINSITVAWLRKIWRKSYI